ncbi:hypothetical protein [Paramicrobacterium agarici]|uniref:hypothetical protein n=1 Tax=Paramicrobacterium agarici TaxID=630514 RepID=UPI0011696510|nr:hypothetical protein [Microbacterium agarici]TQO22278.1 phage integrase family protein [Microbacterium agarici]
MNPRKSRIRRNTDNVRHFTHPLPLLKFGTPLDEADSIPEEAKHAIRTYRPRNAITSAWEHTDDFVRSIAVMLNPDNYDKARLCMTMLGQFVCWVWAAYGCELTIEKIFTATHIRLYVDGEKKDNSYASRFDITRFLGTVTTRLTGNPTHRMLPPLRNPAKPFSTKELASLESWANELSTPVRRRNAHALLALCAGAGLTSQEFVRVETRDLACRNDTYFVTVINPDDGTIRMVPVLREWNRSIETALDGNTNGLIFQGHRGKDVECRGLQSFLTECTLPTDTRATASRLRATWLTTQLNRGTPLPLLLELSGLSSLASLDAHLQNLPAISLADHLDTVAGKQVAA